MKVVILAGGYGTRLGDQTVRVPKPMLEIGGRPILWHIMSHYAQAGFQEFVIALGYRGELIKRYFLDYHSLSGHLSVHLDTGELEVQRPRAEDWIVRLIETGLDTMTGGRLKRLEPWLADGSFLLTYGDGVANVDLAKLIDFHRAEGRLATVTAVRPPSRFGGIEFEGDRITRFAEKSQISEGWINGGFMVLEPGVFSYLSDDDDVLEVTLLEQLARDRQLSGYRHFDFWQCMDTPRERKLLERLWAAGSAPWQTWESV